MLLYLGGNTGAIIVSYLVSAGGVPVVLTTCHCHYCCSIQENTNKAVVADFFCESADSSTTAFACISFTSGISAAFGYFMWPNISKNATAYVVTITCAVGVAGYFAALDRFKRLRPGGE